MKRILLLIALVMMATYFLRSHEERRWDDDRARSSRSIRARAPRPRNLPRGTERAKRHLVEKASGRDVVAAEWAEPSPPSPVDPPTRTISSGMMATEDRAKADAIRKLGEEVSLWLEPEVPTEWKAPAPLVRSMIRKVDYTPVVKDYGTLYVAELSADTSARRRESIVSAYRRETVRHRVLALGGSLAFVLVCLGVISGYIRADEATKGYYTNRLRMLAAAGVGAAGVAVYRLI